jgi:hypothetical protein
VNHDNPTRDLPDDIEVERRLVLAGTLWRNAAAAPPEPDLARMTARPRRALAVTAAAAAVTVLAAGAIVLLGTGGSGGGTATPPARQDEQLRSLDRLLVHNGDTVKATGTVVAEPGKPVRMCLGAIFGGTPANPTCPPVQAVRLLGVDPRTLNLTESAGVRSGRAVVVGTWRDHTITVTSAGPEPDPSNRPQVPPPQPSCPAPAGGWRAGPLADRTALDAYLAAHPDQFGGTDVAFPQGRPGGPTGVNGYTDVAQVIVVEAVTGDLDAIRADLALRYGGNLCVERARYSQRQLDAAASALTRLLESTHASVIGLGHGPLSVYGYLPVVDDAIYPKLAAIEDRYGIGILDLNTDVVPVR